jgi:hypothetical protein
LDSKNGAHKTRLINGQANPAIALAQHPPSTKTPPKRGLCIHDSTACGGIFNISDGHIDSTVDFVLFEEPLNAPRAFSLPLRFSSAA